MIPTTMALLYLIFPEKQQPMAAAMMGMVTTIASSSGPTLGGFVSETLGWRALFWINLAPGLLITIAIWRLLSMSSVNKALLRKVDIPGLIGMALFLGAAEYVLEEGPSKGWLGSSEIWLWTCVSGAGAALFFYRVLTVDTPIVDLRPFKTLPFALGSS